VSLNDFHSKKKEARIRKGEEEALRNPMQEARPRVQEAMQARIPHPPSSGVSFRTHRTTRLQQQDSNRLVLAKLDEAALQRYQEDKAKNQLYYKVN
jgi:hypothetical protein